MTFTDIPKGRHITKQNNTDRQISSLPLRSGVGPSDVYVYLEPCAGRAAPPPTICGRRRRRLLLIGAPPPIICRRAADTIVAAQLFFGIFDDFFFKFSALWQTSNGFMFLDVELLLYVCCIPRSSSNPVILFLVLFFLIYNPSFLLLYL